MALNRVQSGTPLSADLRAANLHRSKERCSCRQRLENASFFICFRERKQGVWHRYPPPEFAANSFFYGIPTEG